MSEAMARAVGAGGPLTVEIGEKQCTVRPLFLRELAEVDRDCLERYRRSYLKTFASNLDLVPKQVRESMMREKFEEAARWDVDDLPLKHTYDPSCVKLTDKLKTHVEDKFEVEAEAEDVVFRRTTVSALSQGLLSEKQYRDLTGEKIRRVMIPYSSWWITGSVEGKITLIWIAFKHEGVSREQVEDALGDKPSLLGEVAEELERLSAPMLGNG